MRGARQLSDMEEWRCDQDDFDRSFAGRAMQDQTGTRCHHSSMRPRFGLKVNGADARAIRYFGLMPGYIGRGLGGYMMQALIRAA